MVVKVHRDRAIALLREIESVIAMIDDKHLFCAIEPGAGGAEQAYRAGAKNSHATAGFDLGVFNCLPGGGAEYLTETAPFHRVRCLAL